MKTCSAVITARGGSATRKNRGKLCGRPVTAFVAPGVGRCGFHDTVMERTRALALLAALRETRELRACPRDQNGHEGEQDGSGPDGPTFDGWDEDAD